MFARLSTSSIMAIRASRAPLQLRLVGGISRYSTDSNSTTVPRRACPSCGSPIPLPASPCPSCGKLVRIPPGLSHHSVLDISTPIPKGDGVKGEYDIRSELAQLPALGYDLEPRDLRNRMLKRQSALHPDKHGRGDADLAAECSARVNLAYETLVHPMRRAEYILSQYDMATQEADKLNNHELLMEVLDARESLESASDATEVEEMRDENHDKVVELVNQITASFSKDPPDLAAVKKDAVELKYWVQLEEAAKEKLSRLGA